MKRRGLAPVIIAVLLLLGAVGLGVVAYTQGWITAPSGAGAGGLPQQPTAGPTAAPTMPSVNLCGETTALPNYQLAIKNGDATTLSYLAATCTYVNSAGQVKGSTASVAGATTATALSAALTTLNCPSTGTIYCPSSATSTGVQSPYVVDSKSIQNVITAYNVSPVSVFAYYADNNSNATLGGGGTAGAVGVNGSSGIALAQGDTGNFKLLLTLNVTAARYGGNGGSSDTDATNGGVIYAFIHNSPNVWATTDFTLGLTSAAGSIPVIRLTACPADVGTYGNAKVCFYSRSLRQFTDGTAYLTVGLHPTLGNPGTGDSPTLRILSRDLAQDLDQSFKYLSYNTAGTSLSQPYLSQWLFVTT